MRPATELRVPWFVNSQNIKFQGEQHLGVLGRRNYKEVHAEIELWVMVYVYMLKTFTVEL